MKRLEQPVVGILGGGQLARMMALAGYPLGMRFVFYDPDPQACAGQVGPLITAEYDDTKALDDFMQQVDVVTFDFENVPVSTVRYVQQRRPVYPDPAVLEISQDRLLEKRFFQKLGLPVGQFFPVNSYSELAFGAKSYEFDGFLKTRRLGYDGKGQFRINAGADLKAIWEQAKGQKLVLEQRVPFEREISVITVRHGDGELSQYAVTENKHNNGVLATSTAPARYTENCQQAKAHARKIAEALEYVGVLVVEFFETPDGVLINEMAPRVHNSGHWTIEGALTSQFENHLRAVCGWPPGGTDSWGYAAMLNWIGSVPNIARMPKQAHIHHHLYGKAPRAGRKVGHTTITADDPANLQRKVVNFAKQLSESLSDE